MSPRQNTPRPLRQIRVNIALAAEDSSLADIAEKLESSTISDGILSLTIRSSDPQQAIEEVRRVRDTIRKALEPSKDFK
jgi:hypothetical protein